MIVGREREKRQLEKVYSSAESEFVVIYGRRRVGKTYLIREFFSKKKCIYLHVTGTQKKKMSVQLERFVTELSRTFFGNADLAAPSWEAAFKLLNQQIALQDEKSKKKVVIFLDELPWLVTRRSGLLELIDYYWNRHWSGMKNVILVACGSSASWLIKNIIHDKGGLHNRLTCEIHLMPFNLYETKEYLKHRKIKLNNRHILLVYMAIGGIPYYLKYVEQGLTADQIIQEIFFNAASPLKDEFKKLFHSLFENAEAYIEIINLVSANRSGLSRAEIQAKAGLSVNGGSLTERLKDLCSAGFLEERVSWHKKKGEYYRLIDEFCLFYLCWVKSAKTHIFPPDYWLTVSRSQAFKSWSGYTFESICLKHIGQILSASGIKSAKAIDSWRYVPRKHPEMGAQIDLLVERSDDAITLFEIKFTQEPFVLDREYAKKLQDRIKIFRSKMKITQQIFIAIISATGVKPTVYSEEMIDKIITMDDLFIKDLYV